MKAKQEGNNLILTKESKDVWEVGDTITVNLGEDNTIDKKKIKNMKLASNGEDFLKLAREIVREDKVCGAKISGLMNIIENVYEKIRRLNGEWDNEPKWEQEAQNKPTQTVQVHDEEDFDKTKVVNY